MVTQLLPQADTEIIYPQSDGQPMADNTIQFRRITVIYYNLAWLFAKDPQVFIAGDLLWYPVKEDNKIRQSPDIMVVFGVAKGDRGSYQQWQENHIAPQVVFEILSPGNTPQEMNRKLLFYDRYGVEEYYLYDPSKNHLRSWWRVAGFLEELEELQKLISPRLGIQLELSSETLMLYRPDGQPFADYVEVQQQLEAAENRARFAKEQLQQTEEQLQQTEKQLQQERQRANRLEQLLREAGIELNNNLKV
jgi:Uma2 family endonuclease